MASSVLDVHANMPLLSRAQNLSPWSFQTHQLSPAGFVLSGHLFTRDSIYMQAREGQGELSLKAWD